MAAYERWGEPEREEVGEDEVPPGCENSITLVEPGPLVSPVVERGRADDQVKGVDSFQPLGVGTTFGQEPEKKAGATSDVEYASRFGLDIESQPRGAGDDVVVHPPAKPALVVGSSIVEGLDIPVIGHRAIIPAMSWPSVGRPGPCRSLGGRHLAGVGEPLAAQAQPLGLYQLTQHPRRSSSAGDEEVERGGDQARTKEGLHP